MYYLRVTLLSLLALTLALAVRPKYINEHQRGNIPSARGGPTMSAVGDRLVLFGGFLECFDVGACEHVFYNDTFIFKTSNNKWTKASPRHAPIARSFHLSASYAETSSIVIYGGTFYNVNFTVNIFFGDVWQYIPDLDIWIEKHPFNAGPGQRVPGGVVVKGHDMYVFGGLDNTYTSHNDLWKYNFLSNLWTLVQADVPDTTPGRPPVRYLSKFEITGDKVYLYGGNINPLTVLGVQRSDLWVLDLSSKIWTQITVPTTVRSRVHGAASATPKGFISSFGDINDDVNECKVNEISDGQNPVNETHVYRKATGWNTFVNVADSPTLKRVAYATIDDELYIWGGFNFVCAATKIYNPVTSFPIWNTNMYTLALDTVGL